MELRARAARGVLTTHLIVAPARSYSVEEILDTLRDRYDMIEAVEMMVEAASA